MKPIVVSLDQNAATALALQRETDASWAHMYEILLSGVTSGHLVCPIPMETEMETVPISPARRARVEALLFDLSHGLRFKDFWELLAEETIALVRTQGYICPLKMPLGPNLSPSWMSNTWVKAYKEVMQSRLDNFVDPEGRVNLSIKAIHDDLSTDRCGDFYRNLESLLSSKPLNPQNPFTAGICEYLTKNRITRKEIIDLRNAVINRKWEEIPIFYYHTMLSAYTEHDYLRGRAPKANDDIDRTRTAMALFSSDYFLTESAMAELCKKMKSNILTPTKVFGLKNRQTMITDLLSELARVRTQSDSKP